MTVRLICYAPSVHTGGGLVLLRALIDALPVDLRVVAFFDERAKLGLTAPERALVHWVRPSAVNRLAGEWALFRAATAGDIVLCFHGLPPLLPSRGHVVVFQQNRIHLGLIALTQFSAWTAVRLAVERIIHRLFRHHVSEYVVQTPSMARALKHWHGSNPAVRVIPFAEPTCLPAGDDPVTAFDFAFVADGVAHKNHRRLLDAWELLALDGIRPTLALTLGERDRALADEVLAMTERTGARIVNRGHLTHAAALELLAASKALIFPSLGESFGLPLIEARDLGVPIVASELDFVRDVCTPAQTFDPNSPVSIARAVKRFLNLTEDPLKVQSPAEFWAALGVAGRGP